MASDALQAASPFAEPYPVAASVLEDAQPAGVWSSELDNMLSLFVRKYTFDFPRCSTALQSYATHVMGGVDGEATVPEEALSPEACRMRWAYLDMKEYERRQKISRDLSVTRNIVKTSLAQAPSHAADPPPVPPPRSSPPKGRVGASPAQPARSPAAPVAAARSAAPVDPPAVVQPKSPATPPQPHL